MTGFWGGLWHSYFRLGLSKTTELLISRPSMPTPTVRLVRLWLAFLISGYIHMCASYMMSRKWDRLFNVLLFFLLQALGITVETAVKQITAHKYKGSERLSMLFNLLFCFVWLVPFTGGLVADDMILGGFLDGQRT
jgi:hypothetical protein